MIEQSIKSVKTIIVGAGPAGLAVAGRMREKNLPFEMLEKTNKIAWAWHNHYDRLCLHTVRELSALPHLPLPEDYPRYVPRLDLVRYFENYAKHFKIQPHFNQSVNSIKKTVDKKWQVRTEKGDEFLAENVVIATGVNRVPFVPKWPGQENYKGTITHSRFYKNPTPYLGQKVLVIGMGNTGAELALDLSEKEVETSISVRSPVSIVPRDLNGRPTQVTAKKLAKLPFGLGDWLGTQIRRVVVGDLTKYGLKTSKMHPAQQLKETGKTPVIDLGTLARIKAGIIKILPDVDSFHETGLAFKNGEKHDFDSVVLATGYRAQLNDFLENTLGLLDKYEVPKSPIGEGAHKGLFFVGFDNYKLGGILGTIYTDSETVVDGL